jgi:hypothetical protein
VRSVEFEPVSQVVRVIVADRDGNQATMIHPYSDRGQFGVELLLKQLMPEQLQQTSLKFISAQVSFNHQGLTLEPIALIFQSGETRQMLQPWIASPYQQNITPNNLAPNTLVTNDLILPSVEIQPMQSVISSYLQELAIALQDLWLVGLERADTNHLQQWQRLVEQGKAIGFDQLLQPIEVIANELAQKFHTLQWEKANIRKGLAIATTLSQLAQK